MIEIPRLEAHHLVEPLPPEHERPQITVNRVGLDDVSGQMVDVLDKANVPPVLFRRGGAVARVRLDEEGKPIIEPVTPVILRYEAARVARYVKMGKDSCTEVYPPIDVCTNVLAGQDWPFPVLNGLAEAPIVRPDGSFFTRPGYDDATGLYHVCDDPVPPILNNPDDDDLARCVAVIDDVFADFPFDGPADRANCWGLLLTSLMRPVVNRLSPMAVIDAPEPGTGKGLMITVINLITTGRPPGMIDLPSDGDELRKNITSMLQRGATSIIFDNVEGVIKSSVLAMALTADTWQDRILGRTEDVQLPNRAVWVATGNNINVGGDLARRCYRIRLDARQALPWKRDGFRHPELEQWVYENRPHLLAALLTIIRSWFRAGHPLDMDLPSMGGFTRWARVVGGVLAHAGVTDFLGNLDAFHAEADREAQQWEGFLGVWHEELNDRGPKSVGELMKWMEGDSALKDALPEDLAMAHDSGRGFRQKFGMAITKRAGRHYGPEGLHVVKAGKNQAKSIVFLVKKRGYFDEVPARPDPLSSQDENDAGTAGSSSVVGSKKLRDENRGAVGEKEPAVPAVPASPESRPSSASQPDPTLSDDESWRDEEF